MAAPAAVPAGAPSTSSTARRHPRGCTSPRVDEPFQVFPFLISLHPCCLALCTHLSATGASDTVAVPETSTSRQRPRRRLDQRCCASETIDIPETSTSAQRRRRRLDQRRSGSGGITTGSIHFHLFLRLSAVIFVHPLHIVLLFRDT